MKKAPKTVFFILTVVIILAMVWLISTKPVKQPELKEILPTRVPVVAVERRDMTATETVTGRIQPSQRAMLQFELAGQVAERKVEPGQRVEAGQLLLSLPSGDYEDALADAQAQLEQEQAGIARDRELLDLMAREQKLQEQSVTRFERLGRDALASKSQTDEAQTRLLQLQADAARLRYSVNTATAVVRQREVAVSRAQRNLARTRLTAPFSGVVNAVNVQPGDTVSPNVAAVELLAVDPLDLYVEVTGATAAALELGQKVEVRVGDQVQSAEIVALQVDPRPSTFTHAVRLRLAGEGLQPGVLAQAELPLVPQRNALVVPIAAVAQEEGEAYVFSVNDGIARRTDVKLGMRVGDFQVITEGVKAGDKIVARNVAALADGERVLAEQVTAE